MAAQRLQLTWYNKDKALIPTETGKYGYTWVDPSDPRYCETHTLVLDDYVQGAQTPKSDEFEYSERADLEPRTTTCSSSANPATSSKRLPAFPSWPRNTWVR